MGIQDADAASPKRAGGLRERKKQATRARLLSVAAKLFAEKGFEGTTVDEIAQVAEVSRGTFFNYFPGKAAAISGLSDGMADRFQLTIDAARAHTTTTTRRLEEVFVESARGVLVNPELSRNLLMETMARRRDIGDRTARIHAGIAELLRDGIPLGEVRCDIAPAQLAAIVAGTFTELLLIWMVQPEYPLEDRMLEAARFLGQALTPTSASV